MYCHKIVAFSSFPSSHFFSSSLHRKNSTISSPRKKLSSGPTHSSAKMSLHLCPHTIGSIHGRKKEKKFRPLIRDKQCTRKEKALLAGAISSRGGESTESIVGAGQKFKPFQREMWARINARLRSFLFGQTS